MDGRMIGMIPVAGILAEVEHVFWIDETSINWFHFYLDADKEEMRKRREEKKFERQKEMEAKRNARQGKGGALKLGARKLGQD